MAYKLRHHPVASRQVETLPPNASRELVTVLETVADDPWSGQRLPDYPKEFRTVVFGHWGIVAYLIQEQRQEVTILQITYAGLA